MSTLPVDREHEVSAVVAAARRWAQGDDRVAALAIVGSRATGAPRPTSDVDLVVLSARPAALLADRTWFDAFGPVELVRAGRFGAVAERRLRRPSGLEVEVCIGSCEWARPSPVDPGTRQVVDDGLEVVFDPQHLLADLLSAVTRRR